MVRFFSPFVDMWGIMGPLGDPVRSRWTRKGTAAALVWAAASVPLVAYGQAPDPASRPTAGSSAADTAGEPAPRQTATDPEEAPTAAERHAAAEAYDRATSAWLAEQYERAAQLFETAHRLAPSSAALVQATRAHVRAGNDLRAATLALRLLARYPDAPHAERVASEVLDDAEQRFTKVRVTCDGCTVDLDGTLQAHPEFFVAPGTTHRVTASFPSGDRTRQVEGDPGEQLLLAFDPPPTAPAVRGGPVSPELGRGQGLRVLPRWAGVAALASTAVLGGVTLWSGVDTLAGVDDYEAMPTRERLDEGQRKERRTNWLIGSTAAAGAVSVVLAAFFTDWSAARDDALDARLEAGPGYAGLRIGGRL
jgi:hypothetical protein